MAGGSLLTKTFFLHFYQWHLSTNVPATVAKPALISLFIRAALRRLHLKHGLEVTWCSSRSHMQSLIVHYHSFFGGIKLHFDHP